MLTRKFTPLLAAIFLIGMATPSVADDPSFVGIWYSPYQPDEPNIMSMIEFEADGTFHEEFRKCDKGEFVGYQTQSGTWSISGNVEHIKTERFNGESTQSESDYTIVMLTETERRIRLEPQGYVFIGHRVMSFKFPECAVGT